MIDSLILAGFRRTLLHSGAAPRPDLWNGRTAERVTRVLRRVLST